MKNFRFANLDRAGQWCSGLCAVHCVLTGFAATLIPALGVFAAGWMESVFLAGSAVLGVSSLWLFGARIHGQWAPLATFGFGFSLLVAARTLLPEASAAESAVTICAGCCIVAAHRSNHRKCRCCRM